MSCHDEKSCPRCGNKFVCNPGNIMQCQCYGIKISDESKKIIETRYADCLCAKCLQYFQEKPNVFKEKFNSKL